MSVVLRLFVLRTSSSCLTECNKRPLARLQGWSCSLGRQVCHSGSQCPLGSSPSPSPSSASVLYCSLLTSSLSRIPFRIVVTNAPIVLYDTALESPRALLQDGTAQISQLFYFSGKKIGVSVKTGLNKLPSIIDFMVVKRMKKKRTSF